MVWKSLEKSHRATGGTYRANKDSREQERSFGENEAE
jgi:hypothetical protein